MDRRSFIKTTSAVAATTAVGTAVAHARDKAAEHSHSETPTHGEPDVVLRLATNWPESVSGGCDHVERFRQRIAATSGGRIAVEMNDFGCKMAGALRDGQTQLHLGPCGSVVSENPVLAYFGGLPHRIGLDADGLESWLLVGGGQDLWDEAAGALGYKMLLAGHLGEAPLLRSTRPITSLAELRSMTVFSPSLGGAVLDALGVKYVDLPVGEIADAVNAGDIDAVEWGGSYSDHMSGLSAGLVHTTSIGINGSGTAIWLTMPIEVWQDLSVADRAVIEAEAIRAFRLQLAESRAHEAMISGVISRQTGMIEHFPPQDVARAVANVAGALVADVASQSALSRRIDASYMAFKAAFMGQIGPEAGV